MGKAWTGLKLGPALALLLVAVALLPAAAQSGDLLAGTAPSEVMGAHQRARVQPAFDALGSADQASFLELIRAAEGPVTRDLLLKALTTGNSLSEMARFAGAVRGKPTEWLLEKTQLCGCTGVRQQFSHTCQVTTLQAMRGRYDPIYALKLRFGNENIAVFDKNDGLKLNPKLGAEQKQLLEAIYRGEVKGATAGVGKPRHEWKDGKRRYLDDLLNELKESTGLSYRTRRVNNVGKAVDLLKAKLTQGIAVPIVIGEKPGNYTHHLLAYGIKEVRGRTSILVHDPWEAESAWVSESEIRAGKFRRSSGSILKHLTYIEVPSRVEGPPRATQGLSSLERTLVERYLAERRGVGAQRAKALVDAFGSKTVEVIEQRPAELTSVSGIGPETSKAIQSAWAELRAVPLPGLEAEGAGSKVGKAPKSGDLPPERVLLEPSRARAWTRLQRRTRLGRLLRVISWRARRAGGRAEVTARLSPLRRADGTLDWKELRARGPKRVLGEVGGLAHFGMALFLKEVAVVARTGDSLRMKEFFDGLLTTDFYKHYGLFVAGARVTEVAYVKYLQRYVKPRFVNGLLKTNLVLAAGMALPLLVEGKLEGKAFVISVASLGLSTAAVRGGVAGIKWVSSLRKARQAGALAKVATAGRLARLGGWFYTAAELAVILYVGEEIDKRITAVVDERAARKALSEAGERFLAALADPKADLRAAGDAYHAAHNDYRNFLYRALEEDEIELARRLEGVARRAKLTADKQRTTLKKLGQYPALRARALKDFPTLEAYAAHHAREAESELQEEVRKVFKSYERARAKHLEGVYAGPRRKSAFLADVSDVDWLLAGAQPGAAGDPSQGRSDIFGRKARERSLAGLHDALGEVSSNRLQAYEDERELIARARKALLGAGRTDAGALLSEYLARIDRLADADQQLFRGSGQIDLKTRQGVVERIQSDVGGR
jgi:hypothetical protein